MVFWGFFKWVFLSGFFNANPELFRQQRPCKVGNRGYPLQPVLASSGRKKVLTCLTFNIWIHRKDRALNSQRHMKEHDQMLNMTGFHRPMTKTLCLASFSRNVNASVNVNVKYRHP